MSATDQACELKTCELCGRLFARPTGDLARDCPNCTRAPITPEDNSFRRPSTYRVVGIKMKL